MQNFQAEYAGIFDLGPKYWANSACESSQMGRESLASMHRMARIEFKQHVEPKVHLWFFRFCLRSYLVSRMRMCKIGPVGFAFLVALISALGAASGVNSNARVQVGSPQVTTWTSIWNDDSKLS